MLNKYKPYTFNTTYIMNIDYEFDEQLVNQKGRLVLETRARRSGSLKKAIIFITNP